MREKLNPRLLDVIACPRCLARLKYDQENQRLICPFEQVSQLVLHQAAYRVNL